MSKFDCRSEFCFHYDKGRFYCNCRLANRSGSAAFTQECEANRRWLALEESGKKLVENRQKAIEEGRV